MAISSKMTGVYTHFQKSLPGIYTGSNLNGQWHRPAPCSTICISKRTREHLLCSSSWEGAGIRTKLRVIYLFLTNVY